MLPESCSPDKLLRATFSKKECSTTLMTQVPIVRIGKKNKKGLEENQQSPHPVRYWSCNRTGRGAPCIASGCCCSFRASNQILPEQPHPLKKATCMRWGIFFILLPREMDSTVLFFLEEDNGPFAIGEDTMHDPEIWDLLS